MYTNRDQQSIFWGFEFSKICIFLGTGHSCCIFGGLSNKCYIFLVFYVFNGIFRPNPIHQVLQQIQRFIIIIS